MAVENDLDTNEQMSTRVQGVRELEKVGVRRFGAVSGDSSWDYE